MPIRKAVFPVAGFGTRFLPATKAQPKEMLPLVDKPVIQYVVEEAIASGLDEIVMVTGRYKRAIEDHFDIAFELESFLEQKGNEELLREVRAVSDLAQFAFIRQGNPRGLGHAVLTARPLAGEGPFAVFLGDDLNDSKVPAMKQMMAIYEKEKCSVIAVERVPED